MSQTKHTPLGVILLLFLIIGATIFVVKDDNLFGGNKQTTNEPPIIAPQVAYHCGFTANTPAPLSTVSFPLAVTGVINNSAATDNCTWALFEGYGGTVTMTVNNVVEATTGITLQGNWMTTGPVPFAVTLIPSNAILSGSIVTLTFTEEDASGNGNPDIFSYTVVAQ